jgi:riboflavin kinase/FMN adenylyltransferase
MLVFDPTLPTDSNPGVPPGAVVTLGNFDGVHQGHVALVQTASTLARDLGNLPVLALALDPHPRALLGQPVPAPLTTPEDRLTLLRRAGATHAALLRVSTALLAWDAETFFQKVLVQSLRAAALVEGHNFCFGRARAGTIDTLKKLCPPSGMRLGVVGAVSDAGAEVSSTRIRAALAQGDVAAANNLLNRPYRLHGEVIHGAHRGRTIGFPTANLAPQTVVPAPGVYACLATLPGGRSLPTATHIGPAPTFADTRPRVEAHLLDFSADLYGQHLSLDFLAHVRPPRQFPSPAELVAQLGHDITAIRALCANKHQRASTP